MKNFYQRGFTLIELLVVIAIIAILVTIGLATFRNAQNRARDAQMISGVRSMQAIVEQHYAQTGSYPAESGGLPTLSDPPLSGRFSDGRIPTGVTYVPTTDGYCLRTSNLNIDTSGNCTGTCTMSGTERFCLTNLQ